MNPIMLITFFIIVNVLTYMVMHIDKYNARNGKKRISEPSLLTLAAIGGSIGMLISMHILHHKTRKKIFKIGVPIIIVLQILLIVALTK